MYGSRCGWWENHTKTREVSNAGARDDVNSSDRGYDIDVIVEASSGETREIFSDVP